MRQDTELKTRTSFGEVTIRVDQDGTVILFGDGLRRIHAIQHFEYHGENHFNLYTKPTPDSDALWFGINLDNDKLEL